MNSQPNKIRSINKFNPAINPKSHIRHQSMNLPLGTPTQLKRPFNKENTTDKNSSPRNISSVSARGSKNLYSKGSNSNLIKNEENYKGLILDGNNSIRYNSGMKKYETPSNQIDKSMGNNKSNTNLNLLGTIKSKR